MSDLRTSFATLEVSGTQEGAVIHKALEGDLIASKNAHGSLVAKKVSDGTFKYLELDDAGNLKVTMDGGSDQKQARGKVAGSATNVDVATITLVANKVYHSLSWVASCFRDAIFEIVQINDATETIIADVLCGSGYLTDSGKLDVELTAGSTGTQSLVIRAKNLNALSDFRASISILEDAA